MNGMDELAGKRTKARSPDGEGGGGGGSKEEEPGLASGFWAEISTDPFDGFDGFDGVLEFTGQVGEEDPPPDPPDPPDPPLISEQEKALMVKWRGEMTAIECQDQTCTSHIETLDEHGVGLCIPHALAAGKQPCQIDGTNCVFLWSETDGPPKDVTDESLACSVDAMDHEDNTEPPKPPKPTKLRLPSKPKIFGTPSKTPKKPHIKTPLQTPPPVPFDLYIYKVKTATPHTWDEIELELSLGFRVSYYITLKLLGIVQVEPPDRIVETIQMFIDSAESGGLVVKTVHHLMHDVWLGEMYQQDGKSLTQYLVETQMIKMI